MADLAELPAKFYSAGFRQESQGEGKDLEIDSAVASGGVCIADLEGDISPVGRRMRATGVQTAFQPLTTVVQSVY